MKIHLLSGFLGSGKTTAIRQACNLLIGENIPVGVITNDQGIRLVDGDYFKSLGIPGLQVENGCFCCNYSDLDEKIDTLIKSVDPACIFAEAVGSCTDMVATVVKPLQRFRPDISVTISVMADIRLLKMLLDGNERLFEASVNYIYFKQLEEAGVIVVSKADIVGPDELEKVRKTMAEKYPGKTILYQNSFEKDSIRTWLNILNNYSATAGLHSLDIDYDLYGAGEAALGWLDEELIIDTAGENAEEVALAVARSLFKKINERGYPIGHLKYFLNDRLKISFTAGDLPIEEASPLVLPARSSTLLINARVQADPNMLLQLVDETIQTAMKTLPCTIQIKTRSAFQPGYPRPAHRIGN